MGIELYTKDEEVKEKLVEVFTDNNMSIIDSNGDGRKYHFEGLTDRLFQTLPRINGKYLVVIR